jgi:hypothetical protein
MLKVDPNELTTQMAANIPLTSFQMDVAKAISTKIKSQVKKLVNPATVTATDAELVSEWYSEMFRDRKPVRYLLDSGTGSETMRDTGTSRSDSDEVVLGSADDFGCVMNNPKENMAIPLLGYSAEDMCEIIMSDAVAVAPDPRDKPISSIIRGKGSGKTRCIESCRRHMLHTMNDTLPLAITYNNNSPIDIDSYLGDADPKLRLRLSVIARLASSFYGISFEKAAILLRDNLPRLDAKIHESEYSLFVTSFLRHMVAKMHDSERPVSKVVIFIDETLVFDKLYHPVNATSFISKALLDKPIDIIDKNGQSSTLGVGLVTTILKLNTEGTGTDSSNRTVVRLPLPQSLNIDDIVNRFWGLDEVPLSDDERTALRLLASTMCDVPRVLEITRKYILKRLADVRSQNVDGRIAAGGQLVTPEFFRRLLKHVNKGVTGKYPEIRVPSDRCLVSLIFNDQKVRVDDDLMVAIKESIATNQIRAPTELNPKIEIIPRVSLFMLRSAIRGDLGESLDTNDLHAKRVQDVNLGPIATCLRECFDTVFQFLEDVSSMREKEGEALEVLYRAWIWVRLLVAKVAVRKKYVNQDDIIPIC